MSAGAAAAASAAALAACLCAGAALAGPTEDARVLFNVGSNAYQRGDFTSAIQAFEQAYQASPRPGILFSIAQAHRRQYVVDKKPGHVATALLRFREYLEQVPSGERRADAVVAISELEPIAADLERQGELSAVTTAKREPDAPPRLMISSSAPSATVTIDGKTSLATPLSVELSPGQHAIDVKAEGFFDDHRSIVVAPKGITALDIALRERPSLIAIKGPSGAEVTVDGRAAGSLPLGRSIEVRQGQHRIAVVMPGRALFVGDVRLKRGESQTLEARMPVTTQRKLAYTLVGVAAASAAAGAIFAGLALKEQSDAGELLDRMDHGQVSCKSTQCPEFDMYKEAVDARATMRGFAGGALGLAALSGGGALALFLTETPASPPPLPLDSSEKAVEQSAPPLTEVSFAPFFGRGFVGAVMLSRF